MKTTTFIISLAIVFLAMSCGNKDSKTDSESEEKTDYPEKITLDVSKGIAGGLSDYFTVENAIIKITTDDYGDVDDMIISIELKKTEADLPFDGSNVGHNDLSSMTDYPFAIAFAVDLFDEDGVPISTGFDSGCDYDSELALLTLNPDETGWIQYDLNYDLDLKIEEVVKIKSIKVKSTLTDVGKYKSNDDEVASESYSDTSSNNDENNSSIALENTGGGEDWDEVLDSYEDYIDSYLELFEKSQNGDIDALAKYPEMMEKANKLNVKLSSADDEMTSSQMARLLKLQTKLASAAY